MSAHVVRQAGQKLHTDIDIPAYLAASLPDRVILIRNNMRIADETLHDPDLVVDPIHQILVVGFRALMVHPLKAKPCDFSVAVRNTEDLHRGLLQIAPDSSVNLIHGAKAAFSEQLHSGPAWPHNSQFLVYVVEVGVVVVHGLLLDSGGQVR